MTTEQFNRLLEAYRNGQRMETDPRDCWESSSEIFDPLDREYGFVRDLAATRANRKCWDFIGPDRDSLTTTWHDTPDWQYLNAPFSALDIWMAKVCYEVSHGARIVSVFPANRQDRNWYHDYVIGVATEIRVTRGRPPYLAPDDISASHPPFGTAVAIYDQPLSCPIRTVIKTF